MKVLQTELESQSLKKYNLRYIVIGYLDQNHGILSSSTGIQSS
jgi:hypothetical protein